MSAQGSKQPNIVFFLIDDLGWADLGCYGSTFHETPNLDRLAAEGALFTDAYAASPVCSPTRASLMTGKYPSTVGVTQYINGHGVGPLLDAPYHWYLPAQERTIARALRDGGYQTWHVGKWHLGPSRTWPDQHGFDVNIAGCDWGKPMTYFSPYKMPNLVDGPEGEYLTDRLTDEAITLIENAGDKPFFLNFWHYAVHIPLEVPEDLVEKYRKKSADMGLDKIDPFEVGEPMAVWHQRHLRVVRRTVQSDPHYAAMMENLDTNIGRLLDALDRLGKREDTIIVFTSDNGGLSTAEGSPTSNLPLSDGKGWTSEGGVRAPLLIRWPERIAAGSRIEEPVTSPDFYPTLLSAAGLEAIPEQHVDGVDFMPLLEGEDFERGAVFFHYPHYSNQGGKPSSAVREGDWKLIHDWETGIDQLYNLREDLGERKDLIGVETELAARLLRLLLDWVETSPAIVPEPNPVKQPYPELAGAFLHGQAVDPMTLPGGIPPEERVN